MIVGDAKLEVAGAAKKGEFRKWEGGGGLTPDILDMGGRLGQLGGLLSRYFDKHNHRPVSIYWQQNVKLQHGCKQDQDTFLIFRELDRCAELQRRPVLDGERHAVSASSVNVSATPERIGSAMLL